MIDTSDSDDEIPLKLELDDELDVWAFSNTVFSKRRKKRYELSLAEKLDVIRQHDEGVTTIDLGRKFRVSRSVITRCIQRKREVIAGSLLDISQIRQRSGKYYDVKRCLIDWFSMASSHGLYITHSVLKTKARDFSVLLGYRKFNVDSEWFKKFRDKNIIISERLLKLRKARFGYVEPSQPSINGYSPEDIYAVAEFGIIPEVSSNKHFRTLLTAVIACNQTGTDKRPLLVLGETAWPNDGIFPFNYIPNCHNSWITSNVFVDWLTTLDSDMRSRNRHILLVLDKSPVHPKEVQYDLTNVKLRFLAKSSNKLRNPCKMISSFFKQQYEAEYTRLLRLGIESGLVLLDLLHLMAKVWSNVNIDVIKYIFHKAGFRGSKVSLPFEGSSAFLENYGFNKKDISFQCFGMFSDQQICRYIKSTRRPDNHHQIDLEKITRDQVLASVDVLRKFLQSNRVSDFSKLLNVHSTILEKIQDVT